MKLNRSQKKLRLRLLEILLKTHFSHIGSCLSVIDIIDVIYKIKNPSDKFVLSCGHSAVALYTILESRGLMKIDNYDQLEVHPNRNPQNSIDISTGSLGQGLPIAVGMALADRQKNIFCLISDGECAEGSIWESLRIIKENNILNLKLVVSVNGWGAYDPISSSNLYNRLKGFDFKISKVNGHKPYDLKKKLLLNPKNKPILLFAQTNSQQFPFLNGQDAHYYIMKDEDYKLACLQLI